MKFKRQVLATAICALPATSFALEALEDDQLGAITGQEGITIDQSYIQTIEEFQYVDGDGDGATGPGKIVMQGITIDSNGGHLNVLDQKIDAAANGVRITEGAYGATYDTSGNLTFDGVSGQDVRVDAVLLGNSAGALNSIGSLTVNNSVNYLSASERDLIEGMTEASGNTTGYIQGATLISSKSDGTTGVVITSESFWHVGEITYSDHDNQVDGSGNLIEDDSNSITIRGLTTFRQGDTEFDTSDYLDATGIRGTYSQMTIDVENGKLVLSDQESVQSILIEGIDIGGQSIGSIAILGNRSVGTTSIYAH